MKDSFLWCFPNKIISKGFFAWTFLNKKAATIYSTPVVDLFLGNFQRESLHFLEFILYN